MNSYPNNPYPQNVPPKPLPHQRFLWWYRNQSKNRQAGFGCLVLIGIFTLCGLCSTISNANKDAQQPLAPTQLVPTPTHQVLILATEQVKTPTPKPTATPEPTPTPTPEPVQQQAPQQLTVTFTGESATVGDASSYVAVHTLPGAALTISVKYCSGHYADSSELKGTQYADASGDNIWTWKPATTCHGLAWAYVTASLNGQSASNSTSFTVS